MNAEWELVDDGSETVDLEVLMGEMGDGQARSEAEHRGVDPESLTRWFTNTPAYGTAGCGKHPWFLASGLLMFLGCYLVNAAVHDRPDELGPVVALVAVLMLYEWLVLGLGVWLWRRRAGLGEARQLLGLAVLLLADTAFVYNELAIANLALGAGFGFLAVVVGVVKLVLITRLAGVQLGAGGWLVAVSGVVMTFALPVAARAVGGSGGLPAWLPTALWWLAAALIALTLWVVSGPRWYEMNERGISRLIVVCPAGSAILHLLAMHWVYHETILPAHLSPVLLGLSVVLLVRSGWGAGLPRWTAAACGWVGLWTAAGGDTHTLTWGELELEWSAFRGWLLAAGLAYGVVWWKRRSLPLLLVWPTAWLLAGLGSSPGVIFGRLDWLTNELGDGTKAILPQSMLTWGAAVIGLAFAALGVGAWLSGRRGEGGPQ
ncbi:MAG: hypothetical protein AAF911_09940 [Planctomycetota bacterium]